MASAAPPAAQAASTQEWAEALSAPASPSMAGGQGAEQDSDASPGSPAYEEDFESAAPSPESTLRPPSRGRPARAPSGATRPARPPSSPPRSPSADGQGQFGGTALLPLSDGEGFAGSEQGGEQDDHEPYSPAQGSDNSPSRLSPKSRSSPALGSYNDLKRKTAFASMTTDGVKKDGTYMIHLSKYRTGPKYSIGSRTPGSFMRGSSTPAPGSYNMPIEEGSKFKTVPRFSFGGCARFGLAEAPTKKMPGPGAYSPKDPLLHMETKVGFGSSSRSKVACAQHNPGPGAYEMRSNLGQGLMFTAGGRHQSSLTRSRSVPGPGAYSPTTGPVFNTPPKCGFGTSTRTDIAARGRGACMPGPGTYEMQSVKSTGSDAPKYSATSRRRFHDLNSYVTPGPGSYNSHVTSFGY